MNYVIVGGVAGGATIAARLKRNDESAKIIILKEVSTYHTLTVVFLTHGGTIESRDQLLFNL